MIANPCSQDGDGFLLKLNKFYSPNNFSIKPCFFIGGGVMPSFGIPNKITVILS